MFQSVQANNFAIDKRLAIQHLKFPTFVFIDRINVVLTTLFYGLIIIVTIIKLLVVQH